MIAFTYGVPKQPVTAEPATTELAERGKGAYRQDHRPLGLIQRRGRPPDLSRAIVDAPPASVPDRTRAPTLNTAHRGIGIHANKA
jgi:hypothetical protein